MIFGWCFSKYGGWGVGLKYVLPAYPKDLFPQRDSTRRHGFYSGHMSRNRGRHGDQRPSIQ